MPTAISFPSTTKNLSLPLLFAGQSQKEFFVNEALSLLDSLMQKTVIAAQPQPPSEPKEGDVYIVTSGSSEWAGYDNALAVFINEGWHFIAPIEGTIVFNQNAGQISVFSGSWTTASEPIAPQNGAVVDAEARLMLTQLTQALKAIGIFP